MSSFVRIPSIDTGNAIERIGKEWMLITVKDEKKGRVNAMTASWGAMGVLWRKDICICFVRPQRHTYSLLGGKEELSVAFLPEKYRDALKLCGTASGRDTDKLAEAGLHTITLDGVDVIEEAEVVLVLKKLYEDDIREESFIDKAFLADYINGDYHRFYICQIMSAYKKGE